MEKIHEAIAELFTNHFSRAEIKIEQSGDKCQVVITADIERNYLDGLGEDARGIFSPNNDTDAAHAENRKLTDAIMFIKQCIKIKNEQQRCFINY